MVLIEVITWTNGDEITVSPDPNTLLTRLQADYRPTVTTPYDSLMLLTYVNIPIAMGGGGGYLSFLLI